jgi:hypothetical protein
VINADIYIYRDPTILGSAVQHISVNPYCPVLIIKDEFALRSKHPSGRLRYAVCSDGSEKSLNTISFTSRLLDRSKGDELVVICVETTKINSQSVNDTVNHYLEGQGVMIQI